MWFFLKGAVKKRNFIWNRHFLSLGRSVYGSTTTPVTLCFAASWNKWWLVFVVPSSNSAGLIFTLSPKAIMLKRPRYQRDKDESRLRVQLTVAVQSIWGMGGAREQSMGSHKETKVWAGSISSCLVQKSYFYQCNKQLVSRYGLLAVNFGFRPFFSGRVLLYGRRLNPKETKEEPKSQ